MTGIEPCLEYWRAGGILLVPIAAVSVGIWGYFLRSRALLVDLLKEGRHLVADPAGPDRPPGRLRALFGALRRDAGSRDGAAALFEVRSARATAQFRRDFVVLAVLTSVAPLLGLLGTVNGMIETFEAVAGTGGDTGQQVASGVSRALITTQFGLVVAIPGVFGLVRLRRLLDHVRVQIDTIRIERRHEGGRPA